MKPSSDHDLVRYFDEVNAQHFEGFLELPKLQWNSRLRSSAGRFIPSKRALFRQEPPIIEVASYLLTEEKAKDHVMDTLAHEMIHYWLWVRKRPFGHTPEFWEKMNQMGVSRYNPVPRNRSFKYLYRCPSCSKEYPARRRLARLACGTCCKSHSRGKFDSRFMLEFSRPLSPGERLKSSHE